MEGIMVESKGIRIAVIPGSVRPGNYTAKAVALLVDEIGKHEGIGLDLFDLAELDLPAPGAGADTPAIEEFRERVSNATGVIFATPEYHGSFSSLTKLAIENLGFPSVLAGKPVGLLGVAAGVIESRNVGKVNLLLVVVDKLRHEGLRLMLGVPYL